MKNTATCRRCPGVLPDSPDRRRLLGAALASTLATLAAPARVAAARSPDDPRRQPPQVGDVLSYPSWENDGRRVKEAEVALHAPPVSVYPADPASGVVRERSRLNLILLVRFAVDELGEKTRQVAANGIVAYSGVCTHTACGVSEWSEARRHFICPCHASEFDPRNRARVVGGPAPRALPALPIRIEQGAVVVAGAFTGRVGASQS